MSIRATYRFSRVPEWITYQPNLNGTDIRVFAALDRFDGRECIPGLDKVAERIGCTERTIRASLRNLEAVGAIRTEPRYTDDGRQTSNRYVLAGDEPFPPARKKSSATGGKDSSGTRGKKYSADLEQDDLEQEDPENARAAQISIVDHAFQDFWSFYPRRVGKPRALTAWKTAMKSASQAQIYDGLDRWCRYWNAQKTELNFIPHPATWLNQERWNDEPPPVAPNGKSATGMDKLKEMWFLEQGADA